VSHIPATNSYIPHIQFIIDDKKSKGTKRNILPKVSRSIWPGLPADENVGKSTVARFRSREIRIISMRFSFPFLKIKKPAEFLSHQSAERKKYMIFAFRLFCRLG
jgi:hypothetical protein